MSSPETTEAQLALTDEQVIAAIRKCHLKANIACPAYGRKYWDQAWLDVGGTFFGLGPYVHLPVNLRVRRGKTERVVIRVYPPERLRRQLAKRWRRSDV